MSAKRRVVVTGLGILSPVGNDVETAWKNILAGYSGIENIESFDVSNFSTKFAGLVKDFDVTQYGILPKDARKMDDFVQYGVAAAHQAIKDAGIDANTLSDPTRYGVCIGSGIGGIGSIEENHLAFLNQGPRRISPFFIPGAIINIAAGYVSIFNGFQGPNLAFSTACTTGAHSIGMAARLIQYGDADVMVAGGAEKASTTLGLGGFAAVRALSSRNEAPKEASRPFDTNRDGFVLADGAGVLVLEEYEHAKKRGAKIYAELAGFGMSGDAYHITQTSDDGSGGARAMEEAIKDANISPDSIDHVNAHATSTPVGDVCETLAIKRALGEHAYRIPVSATKSMTGHLLGAAGAVEAIFSILSIRDQMVPPTINLSEPDPKCDLDYVPNVARTAKVDTVLSNSFGFGGTNGALIFKRV